MMSVTFDTVHRSRQRLPLNELFKRDSSSVVSIRQDDLLAIAPEYRRKVKENVTSRRIGIDGNLLEDIESTYLLDSAKSLPAAQKHPPDPVAVFFQEFGEAAEGDGFYVAKESASIRGINALVGERSVHCVADNATCNELSISFDPNRRIPLQSANGQTDWTLGVAKDSISWIRPRTTFLLGRPFEILTQARIQNFLSGDQHYTLTDPNTSNSGGPSLQSLESFRDFARKTEGVEVIEKRERGVAYTLEPAPPPPTMVEFDDLNDGDEVPGGR
ncbi:hypothetical protein BT96DRAFT_1048515 [Gymnopus androsaceus JB14]|uniref:Uncharacterized protein n=1 Tax=Gymnopus androsaceus JB14 TaxID=1447944 RepID=A0A6A4GB32_9AGAR|nr:hypothetical protein BT96DRAFT_1048515 [Gymnopus androsaceus JB14]